jgi:uracil-DNA glycosylase family 4
MNKSQRLEKLNKEVRSCKKCSLWGKEKKAVPGEGPANARIMIIGEAPGREEDLSGRPFCGRAGKLLSHLLEKNGFKRDGIFITSVVKHRPPKNRQPKKPELLACRIWWEKQIGIIKPRLIILLGRVATDTVLGKEAWDKRGKVFFQGGQGYFITYHPAAGLRFPKIKKILEKDFKELKRKFTTL